ncbi:MDR family MFS transporter [Weissella bombi]|uniref:Drug resistance transporter, EmrB/QacA subfamily n=1 Tax=Weissella bombi TaxID=1505725 RepID=A0A1C3ZBB0_9LACO|nr:MDR family MFS transporter [Weissella bombi]SCB79664.1 drug resistance transporter, EmrB/QacA subfamily [Weissella bombi]
MAQSKQTTLDMNGKPFNRTAMVAVLLIGTFAGVLMQTSLGTAIPTLMHDFDISFATAQQATTWFLLANGVMMPVSAFLSTRIKSKVLYNIAYALLTIGMAVTAFTPAQSNMWWLFLAGRIITAIAVGVTMPLMQVVMINIYPVAERGAAMGLNGIVIGLAPAIGPSLSGWILEKDHVFLGLTISDSWRTIFILPLIVIVIAFILSFFFVKNVLPTKKIKLDVLSFILSILGFGVFLWGFTNVATDGWGDIATVVTPIVLGIVVIILFIWRQLKMDVPFMDVRVFKNKQFTITTVAVMMTMMAMIGVQMMLPTYLQNVHGMSTLDSGLVLLPGALLMGIMAPIAGRSYDRIGAKRLSIVGFVILAISTFPFMFITTTTPGAFITTLYAVRMFGVAMAMMPLTTMSMSVLPPNEAADATASNNTARQVASSVVVALLTSVTQNIITNNQPSKALQAANPLQYGSDILDASMKGFHVSFAIGFAFSIVGIILALFISKGRVIPYGMTNGATIKGEKEA